MSDTIILYHGGCFDGFFSAYACFLKNKDILSYIPLYHSEYDNKNEKRDENFSKILELCTGKKVFMVDFSFPYDYMCKLINSCSNFLVLDHHDTAQKALQNIPDAHKIFDMTKSGAVLAWEFFHPGVPVPESFLYVQDRDLWKWELKEYSEPFSVSLYNNFDIFIKLPKEDVLPTLQKIHLGKFEQLTNLISEKNLPSLISEGKVYVKSRESTVNQHLNNGQKVIFNLNDKTFQGVLVNSSVYPSELGNALCKNLNNDFAVIYTHKVALNTEKNILENIYSCSIRSDSDECDVGAIAKKLGGGGHKRASGFRIIGNLWDYFNYLN